MNVQVIKGSFPDLEARELIRQMIQTKISYHELKISKDGSSEEDIKMRERRIIELQNDLTAVLKSIPADSTVELTATLEIKA